MHGVYHDMHRIGFRRALPLAFTLLYVVLVWLSLPLQPRTTRIIFHDSEHRAVAYQEDTGIPVETLGEPPPLKPVQKMALIVELPAMFVAMLIGALLFPRHDAAWLYTSESFCGQHQRRDGSSIGESCTHDLVEPSSNGVPNKRHQGHPNSENGGMSGLCLSTKPVECPSHAAY
jgi:hypothetical protein